MVPGEDNLGNQYCNRIPDLTGKQKTELTKLAETNQTKMAALRTEMQASTDIEKRGDIAKKMQILRDTHRSDMLNLLTDKQKEVLNANGNFTAGWGGRGPANCNFGRRGPRGGNGWGRMNGNGYGNRRGRMNGNGYGNGFGNRFGQSI